jgi:hypothetical protein
MNLSMVVGKEKVVDSTTLDKTVTDSVTVSDNKTVTESVTHFFYGEKTYISTTFFFAK